MIHLFRKDRLGMLTGNNITRYLLYATGEILLVVIGIIIALMLDDWHDRRELEKEKVQFIDALINDYKLDSIILVQYIERNTRIESNLREINNRAYQPLANLDTIISLAKHEYTPSYDYISNYNIATYKTIESTGKIELFDAALRAQILKHHQYQNLSIENQKINAQSIIRKVDEYTNKYKIGAGFTMSDGYLSNMSWDIEDEREFVVLFTEMIGINRLIIEIWVNQYRSMLEGTTEMIYLLENQR